MILYILSAILVVLILILARLLHMSAATDAFTTAINQLDSDVQKLVAQGGPAAVDAFATQATQQVQAIDSKVQAALTPTP